MSSSPPGSSLLCSPSTVITPLPQSGPQTSLDSALDLLRRLPPSKIGDNVALLSKLLPPNILKLVETSVDIPLKIAICPKTKSEFLCSPFNKITTVTSACEDESYRSPWTHQPQSEFLLTLELLAQESFSTFRQLYYDGGISSAFVLGFDGGDFGSNNITNNNNNNIPKSQNQNFILAILIKNTIDTSTWDSIHLCTVKPTEQERTYTYSLNSTILLHFDTTEDILLSGSVCKESASKTISLPKVVAEEHIINIGRLVEEAEGRLRSEIQEIYFGRTHDLINEVRGGGAIPEGFLRNQDDLAVDIASSNPTNFCNPNPNPNDSKPPAVMVLPPIPFFQPGQSPKDILRQINEQKKQSKLASANATSGDNNVTNDNDNSDDNNNNDNSNGMQGTESNINLKSNIDAESLNTPTNEEQPMNQ